MTVVARSFLVVLLLVLSASCQHALEIRPGPAMEAVFSPPPGGALVETWKQSRVVAIDFQGGDTREIREEVGGKVVEEYAPWHDGWRVTSTVLEEAATRDGVNVPPALPLIGVAFSHRVNEEGGFVESMDVDESLRTIRERIRDGRLRDVLETVLTPELLASRVERSWRERYEGACNVPLAPGDVSYAVEEQALPAGGTARTLCRRTVVGQAVTQGRATVEIALEYGGASSAFLKDPAAVAVAEEAGGVRSLTEHVKGRGVRFVSLPGCHVLAEESHFAGYSRLNETVAEKAGLGGLPKRVRFEIDRSVERRPKRRSGD